MTRYGGSQGRAAEAPVPCSSVCPCSPCGRPAFARAFGLPLFSSYVMFPSFITCTRPVVGQGVAASVFVLCGEFDAFGLPPRAGQGGVCLGDGAFAVSVGGHDGF